MAKAILTLEEYNARWLEERSRPQLAGCFCADCDVEMVVTSNVVLLSYPAKREIKCPACGKLGYQFC